MLDKGKTIMADASLPQNIASLVGTGFDSGWGCDWSQGLTKLYSFAELINYIIKIRRERCIHYIIASSCSLTGLYHYKTAQIVLQTLFLIMECLKYITSGTVIFILLC